MGTLQLTDLRDEVQRAFALRDDLTDARTTRIINLAQERIARARSFDELGNARDFSLTYTGTPATDKFHAYSLVTAAFNPKEIFSLRVIDGDESRKLKYKTIRGWDAILPATQELNTDRPVYYTTWNDKFELFPVINKAYTATIRTIDWPTALSGDTDTSDLDHKDEIIIAFATAYLYHSFGNREEGARWFAIGKDQFDMAVAEESERPDAALKPDWAQPSTPFAAGREYWRDPFFSGFSGD